MEEMVSNYKNEVDDKYSVLSCIESVGLTGHNDVDIFSHTM